MNVKNILERTKYSIKGFAYDCLYASGLLTHKTKVDWDNVPHIRCNDNEIRLIFTGTSAIYYIETKSITGYFRTVLPHLSHRECIFKAVEDYFTTFFPEQKEEYESVKKALNNSVTYRKFANMGNIDNPYSRSRKFRLTKDTRIVGIETPDHLVKGSEEWKSYINNIIQLLRYVRINIQRRRRNYWGGKYEFSGVNRQMATEAVAKLLGLDYMIPHSEFVVINTNDKELHGTIMAVAEGESTNRLSNERYHEVVSPNLQRELISLNVLDTITYERDHRPGNYNMVLDKNDKVEGLVVYDNDAAMTFAPFPASIHQGSGCSAFLLDGRINRPFMDKKLADTIMNLKENDLKRVVKPFLNHIQSNMCWHRIIAIQSALMKSDNDLFLLEPEEWSNETINKEMNGQYGRTYLKLFVDYAEISMAFYDYCHVADF